MACVVCSHTMNCIQTPSHSRPAIFACPRCGVIRKDYGSVHEDHERYVDYIPRLAANAYALRWLDVVRECVPSSTQG